jgi:hypothetical protein
MIVNSLPLRPLQVESLAQVLTEHPDFRFGAPALARHKRRRANAYNRRRRFKRPRVHGATERGEAVGADGHQYTQARGPSTSASIAARDTATHAESHAKAFTNRRMRRGRSKRSAQLKPLELAQPQRLPTHDFLCTRFVMDESYGWKLPKFACGKGHRCKALNRALRQGAVLHDISYWISYTLKADKATLAAALEFIMVPDAVLGSDLVPAQRSPSETTPQRGAATEEATGTEEATSSPSALSKRSNEATASQESFKACIRSCFERPGASFCEAWLVQEPPEPGMTAIVSPALLELRVPPVDTASDSNTQVLPSGVATDGYAACPAATATLTVHPAAQQQAFKVLQRLAGCEVSTGGHLARWWLTGGAAAAVAQRTFCMPVATLQATQTQHTAGSSQLSVIQHALVCFHCLALQLVCPKGLMQAWPACPSCACPRVTHVPAPLVQAPGRVCGQCMCPQATLGVYRCHTRS